MINVAVLDDYQSISKKVADWSPIEDRCKVTVFDRHIPAHELAEVLKDFEIICLLRERTAFPRELIRALPKLKFLAISGRYNRTLDAHTAAEQGIAMSHTSWRGTGHYGTPELAWALILSLARHVPFESNKMKTGGWQDTVGTVLAGRTIGLVGFGRLGRRMARIAQGFEMNVIAWSHNLTTESAAEDGAVRVEKDELLSRSDVVSIHYVLGERSKGLIGKREFELMQPTALLVNTSRGPIVDEAALIEALRSRRIAGSGLDVFDQEPLPDEHPLRSLDNAILTPHLGYTVIEFLRDAYEDTVENIDAFLKGAPIRVLTPENNWSSRPRP